MAQKMASMVGEEKAYNTFSPDMETMVSTLTTTATTVNPESVQVDAGTVAAVTATTVGSAAGAATALSEKLWMQNPKAAYRVWVERMDSLKSRFGESIKVK